MEKKLIEQLQPETRDALENIMDTMGDAGSFYPFLMLLIDVDHQAAEGDPASIKLISMVTDFSRLINAAQRPWPRQQPPPSSTEGYDFY